jgi:hypothetical protein
MIRWRVDRHTPIRPTERVRLCRRANRASWRAGVLTAAVGVHDNRLGPLAADGDRHGQRGLNEIGARVLIDGPAGYPPRALGVSALAGGRGCLSLGAGRVLTRLGAALPPSESSGTSAVCFLS